MNPDATLLLEKEFLFFSSLVRVGLWRTRLSVFKGELLLKLSFFKIFPYLFSLLLEKGTCPDKFLRLICCFLTGW